MQAFSFEIGSRRIGTNLPLFFIAEAGVNHNGDIELARRMIDAAKEAGADAVKFQTFRAENLNTRTAPKSSYHVDSTGPDSQQSWFELLKSQELTREMHVELIKRCRERDIIFLSTPYDEGSVDLLVDLDVPAFKISSTDANNIPFLRYVARKGRPVILSTGMCALEEVCQGVQAIRAVGLAKLVVLHCTSSYPSTLRDTNLRAMVTIRDKLNVLVGYSDHTAEYVNPILATALGAVVFEKHFTLDKGLPGPDHRMSLTPNELKQTIDLIRQAEVALGEEGKAVTAAEEENRLKLRKSIVASRDLKSGTILEVNHLALKRPGTGMPPAIMDQLIGRQITRTIREDEQIRPEDIR